MTRFRSLKQALERMLLPPAWPEEATAIPEAVSAVRGMEAVSPLLALLPRGGLLKWRAVLVLGSVTAHLAENTMAENAMPENAMEDARTVMRRCMWHLNEDSGNMGWGVAEAMGEAAAQSPALAREYGKVILSYARDTGFADNFIDHAALRRGTYWAIGRFAPLYPAFRAEGLELLLQGLEDEDAQSRGIAAWGVGNFAKPGPANTGPVNMGWTAGETARKQAAAKLAAVTDQDLCEILDGMQRCVEPAAVFARQALNRLTGP